MRKYLLLLMSLSICQLLVAQNVGIGTTSPLTALHIKRDNEALRIQGTIPYMTFYDNAGTIKAFMQSYLNDLYLGTPSGNTTGNMQFYLNNIAHMTIKPNGQIGIGTTLPNAKLHILHAGPTAHLTLEYPGLDNFSQLLFTNTGGSRYWGMAGKISSGSNSSDLLSFYNTSTVAEVLVMTGNGNVGIGLSTPSNKLQIGSVGSTGFAGNDLAIGNGTNAMAIYQTNTTTTIGSTTDIILKPRNSGLGRVGINTSTPRAALDVTNYVNINTLYTYLNYASYYNGIGNCLPCTAATSIFAENGIMASEFDANSDCRIKDIIGVSNSAEDLETINALRITDYTLKDKVQHGDKPYKKVIAQDVEKVFPQVVSKHVDFIPNVYQLANKIEKTGNGYLLTFTNKHNISGSAKKLRVLLSEGKSMGQVEIVSIPSEYQVLINVMGLTIDRAFVYGEEVDDFRTVDYEGLATLNISATQELSKLIKKQQVEIDALIEEIKRLKERGLQ